MTSDADKMLAEMIRVTKPGGRVGVFVRALDLPWVINLELPDEIKIKVGSGMGVAEEGVVQIPAFTQDS